MSGQDFLHIHAETKLCEYYSLAGSVCSLATNRESLLSSARATFPVISAPVGNADFSLRFWVDDADEATAPWPQPYVRGLDHRVFAGFDTRSSVLADLRRRRIVGRFSAAMAADSVHWRTVVFPVLMSILSGSIGWVELHASCVAKSGRGLVLLGPSRSGKSTLAMAFSQDGFQMLSDDRIFCLLQGGDIVAYGLPRPLKLRQEAAHWFGGLPDQDIASAHNGDRVFYRETNQHGEMRRGLTCQPQALVFLEHRPDPGFRLIPVNRNEARSSVEADLLAEAPEAIAAQGKVLDRLASLPCWRLQYNGSPQWVAGQIEEAVFEGSKPGMPDYRAGDRT